MFYVVDILLTFFGNISYRELTFIGFSLPKISVDLFFIFLEAQRRCIYLSVSLESSEHLFQSWGGAAPVAPSWLRLYIYITLFMRTLASSSSVKYGGEVESLK